MVDWHQSRTSRGRRNSMTPKGSMRLGIMFLLCVLRSLGHTKTRARHAGQTRPKHETNTNICAR